MRKETTAIVVHCAATKLGSDGNVGLPEFERWHKVENGWSRVGYNIIIPRSGVPIHVDHFDSRGIHAGRVKRNHDTFPICLVGGLDEDGQPMVGAPVDEIYNKDQLRMLSAAIEYTIMAYPRATLGGHCDIDPMKTCPCFDVRKWWKQECERLKVVA